MLNEISKDAKDRMEKTVESLKQDLAKIRTGRAHPSILDAIMVSCYGTSTPLKQIANVAVEDARTLSVTPYDKSMVEAVDKAIRVSSLGLNPTTAGMVIRIPLPPLTEERRREFTKLVKQDVENSRVAIRNIRRDANNSLKELLKEKEISKDEDRSGQEGIQKLTDKYIGIVDSICVEKEKEIMQV